MRSHFPNSKSNLTQEVNKKRLLTAIANVKVQKNLVEMQLEDLEYG
ncbi:MULTISPECIES: hypothetical protein [Spirulina sp. CCY15215]|nr:hypothetical protein [Spirulina major]